MSATPVRTTRAVQGSDPHACMIRPRAALASAHLPASILRVVAIESRPLAYAWSDEQMPAKTCMATQTPEDTREIERAPPAPACTAAPLTPKALSRQQRGNNLRLPRAVVHAKSGRDVPCGHRDAERTRSPGDSRSSRVSLLAGNDAPSRAIVPRSCAGCRRRSYQRKSPASSHRILERPQPPREKTGADSVRLSSTVLMLAYPRRGLGFRYGRGTAAPLRRALPGTDASATERSSSSAKQLPKGARPRMCSSYRSRCSKSRRGTNSG